MPSFSDDDEVLDTCHDFTHGHVGDGVLAVVEEGVFVKADPAFVDAAFAEGVADPFAQHDGDHDGEDVGEGACELKHDYDDGDGHACYTAQGGRGTDDGKDAGRDTFDVGGAGGKEDAGWVRTLEGLDEGAGCAAVERADGHGGEYDASGDLEAEGGGCEERGEERGEEKKEDWRGCVGGVAEVVWVLSVRRAFGKECGDERGGLRPHEDDGVVYERGDERDHADFKDGVVPNTGGLAQRGNVHVEADEAGTVEATEDAQERERDELKVVPAAGVLDLVEHQFAGAERIHKLQCHSGNHGSDEALPHCLIGEVVGELFEAEEHATNGGAESD